MDILYFDFLSLCQSKAPLMECNVSINFLQSITGEPLRTHQLFVRFNRDSLGAASDSSGWPDTKERTFHIYKVEKSPPRSTPLG